MIVSYVVGFFWEIVFAVVRGHEISEGLFVTAMLFPLTLPPTTPLWQAALGISFGIVIGKEIFGGTGPQLSQPGPDRAGLSLFCLPGPDVRRRGVDGASRGRPTGGGGCLHRRHPAGGGRRRTAPAAWRTALAEAGYYVFEAFFRALPGQHRRLLGPAVPVGRRRLVLSGHRQLPDHPGRYPRGAGHGLLLNLLAGETSSCPIWPSTRSTTW